MIRIEVRQWNGQFDRPGMLDVIRRKITSAQCNGSVLVDFEDATLTPEQVILIMAGFPPHKFKFCGSLASLPHPVPENAILPKPREKKRNPRQRRGRNDK